MIDPRVSDVHALLTLLGIPVVTVRFSKDKGLEAEFEKEATPKQQQDAKAVMDTWNQAEVDAAKPDTTLTSGLTGEEVKAAKTVNDIKDLLIKAYNLKG